MNEPETFKEAVKRRTAIWEDAEKARSKVPRKPSLPSRLFGKVGQKRRGWSGRRVD